MDELYVFEIELFDLGRKIESLQAAIIVRPESYEEIAEEVENLEIEMIDRLNRILTIEKTLA